VWKNEAFQRLSVDGDDVLNPHPHHGSVVEGLEPEVESFEASAVA